MTKKELADHVFYNVIPTNQSFEAIAIYQGIIIDVGTIPYIFSNYKGFKDYNAQGLFIQQTKDTPLQIGESATGIVITKQAKFIEHEIIWQIVNNNCIEKNINLLDPHWNDH